MAGKKINDSSLLVESVNNNDLVPISTSLGTAQVSKVSAISDLIKNNIGITLPNFSESLNYLKGDLVAHNGKIYKFTDYKEIGAWNSSIVAETSILDELNGMSSNPSEIVNVSIVSSDPDFVKSGINIDLVIGQTVVSKTTSSNGTVSFEVTKGNTYTIQTSDIVNYYHVASKTLTAVYNSRNLELNFIPITSASGVESVNVKILKYDGNNLIDFTEALGSVVKCSIGGGRL